MFKRMLIVAALLSLAASAVLAAPPEPIVGKVFATSNDTLVVNAKFDDVKWLKEGAKVKVDDGKGMVIAVEDSLITIVTQLAEELKVDAEVKIAKARKAMTGC